MVVTTELAREAEAIEARVAALDADDETDRFEARALLERLRELQPCPTP